MTTPPPSPQVLALIDVWPAETWVSEPELVNLLVDAGHDVRPDHAGQYRFQGRRLRGLLNEARRTSRLLRDQRAEPVVYTRPVPGYRGTPKEGASR